MEVTIDLKELLASANEDGEDFADLLKAEIAKKVTENLSQKINEEIINAIKEALKAFREEVLSKAIEQTVMSLSGIIDEEYQQVDRWGDKGAKTTLRKQFTNKLIAELQYGKTSSRSDRNAFTKGVDDILEAEISKFQKSYDSKVDEIFTKEALAYATRALESKLGLK